MNVSRHARERFRERFPDVAGKLSDAKVDAIIQKVARKASWHRAKDGTRTGWGRVSRGGVKRRLRLVAKGGTVVTVTGR